MSAKELRELLADVPDHYEVGIEILVADDRDVIPIEGKSDTRWDCTFALLCDNARLTDAGPDATKLT